MDATVLSAHVALCSGDDLESVKELVLHPMDVTVASVSSRFSIVLHPIHLDATVLDLVYQEELCLRLDLI